LRTKLKKLKFYTCSGKIPSVLYTSNVFFFSLLLFCKKSLLVEEGLFFPFLLRWSGFFPRHHYNDSRSFCSSFAFNYYFRLFVPFSGSVFLAGFFLFIYWLFSISGIGGVSVKVLLLLSVFQPVRLPSLRLNLVVVMPC